MIHHYPFAALPRSAQKNAFILLTCLTISVMAVLLLPGGPLKTEHAPLGIVSFEFAKTPLLAQRMLDSWGPVGQVYAGLNLGLDYVFLVLYPSSLALGCGLVGDLLKHQFPFLGVTGVMVSWSQLVAGGLDAVENVALIKVLLGANQPIWPELAWWCALLKFTIVFVGLGYLVGGSFMVFIHTRFVKGR